MFTEKQINEILAVCGKATPGPWEAEHGEWDCNWECGHKAGDPECHKEICECEHIKQYIPADVRPLFTVDCGDFMGLSDDNADFIALARTALPQLAEDYRKLAEYALQVEKALDLLLDNLFEMDDETCPADVDGENFCCDVNICGVERPYKKCWLKFYLGKAKAGEAAGYGGEE